MSKPILPNCDVPPTWRFLLQAVNIALGWIALIALLGLAAIVTTTQDYVLSAFFAGLALTVFKITQRNRLEQKTGRATPSGLLSSLFRRGKQ